MPDWRVAGRPAGGAIVPAAGAAAIGVAAFAAVPNDYAYIPAALVFALLGAATLSFAPAEHRRFLFGVFAVGMAVRVAAGIAFYYTSLGLGGDGTPAGKDDRAYFEWGSTVLQAWRDGSLTPPPRTLPASTQHGYIYLNAILFGGLGQHLLVPVMFNAAVGALTAVPVFTLARSLWGNRAARFGAMLVVAHGPLVFYSALNMKDALIAFLAVGGLAVAVESREALRPSRALALVATWGALMALRPVAGGLFATVGAIFVGLPLLRRTLATTDRGWLANLWPGAAHQAEIVTGYAVAQVEQGTTIERLRGFTTERAGSAEGEVTSRLVRDDSLFRLVQDATGLRKVAVLPLAVIYTLVQPFPPWPRFGEAWHFNVLILANIAWLAAVPFGVYGLLQVLRHQRRRAAPVVLFVVLWFLAIAWTYFGIQSRYRLTIEPIALALAGGAIAAWPRPRPLVALWALAIGAAMLLYLALKSQLPLPVLGVMALAWAFAAVVAIRRRVLQPLLGLAWLAPLPGDAEHGDGTA